MHHQEDNRAGLSIESAVRLTIAALIVIAAPWLLGHLNFYIDYVMFLGGGAFGLTALLIIGWKEPPRLEPVIDRFRIFDLSRAPNTKLILVLLITWFVGGIWLLGFPISDDIYAAQMQALTYASGRLHVPAPPLPGIFSHWRFVAVDDIWISQYPPGWALLLLPFAVTGLPFWLAPGLLAVGSVALFWKISRRRLEEPYALLAMATLATSAFFILNVSTMYAHAPTLFFGLAAVFSLIKYRENQTLIWALTAGLCVGAMGVIRPFNALLFICVLGPVLLLDVYRSWTVKRVAAILVFGIGGLPFAAILLGYHYLVTGSPFTTIPAWMGKHEPLGVLTKMSFYYSIERGAGLVLMSSPVLAAAVPAAPLLLWRASKLEFTDFLFPVCVLAFLLYGGSGDLMSAYGPRYLFEVFPFLVLSGAALLQHFGLRKPIIRALVSIHLIVQISGLMSWLAFERVVILSVTEPFRMVEEARLENAVVILEDRPYGLRRTSIRDYTKNGLDIHEPSVVYARDLKNKAASRARLRAEFPNRSFWTYSPDDGLKPLE